MITHRKLRPVKKYERYAVITLGIMVMALGFYYFIIPADLVAGGVTGISLILHELLEYPISYFVFACNMLLLLTGYLVLGKRILLRSVYGSLVFPFILFLYEQFLPMIDIESDFLLAATFGGVLVGFGFGLVIRYGGTSGGTDILIRILNKRFNVSVANGIYITDGIIVLLGVITFYAEYGVKTGLYALIALYISGVVADRVILGNNQKKAVQIITDRPTEIKEAIYESIQRGVTEVKIVGGYTKHEKTMLVSVITKGEYYILRNIVANIDETAFVYVTPATEIQGDFVERESEEE